MGIIAFLGEWYGHVVAYGPSNRFFSGARLRYYSGRLAPESGRFSSLTGLSIPCPRQVSIGEEVSFNQFVLLDACDGGRIRIGDRTLVGPFVVMRASDHEFSDPGRPILTQGHRPGRIVVGEDCWIGSHVTITRDVTIGRGSVIGAGSVVTRDIPPFSIAAGNPARIIGSRGGNSGNPDLPGGQG